MKGLAPEGAGTIGIAYNCTKPQNLKETVSLADMDALTQLIEPEVKALGFALVRIKLTGSAGERTLQVMAERPDTRQLVIEDCAELSRRLSEKLDESDPIEGAYRLEVSSPGIDRPLTRLQDFADWSGSDARVNLREAVGGSKTLTGILRGVDGDQISFEDRTGQSFTFGHDTVHAAKLILTDRLIAETTPISADDAEEIETETLETEQED